MKFLPCVQAAVPLVQSVIQVQGMKCINMYSRTHVPNKFEGENFMKLL